jgi:YidC/Oxa1 family membrane protein insertase
MSKRIFFVAMMLFLVLTLSACQRPDNTPVVIVSNNPIGTLNTVSGTYDKLVYTESQASNVVFKGDNGLSYWTLQKAGAAVLTELSATDPLTVEYTTNADGVRTYTYNVSNLEANFQIYVKPDTLVGEEDDIVMIAFRFEKQNLLYQKGQTFRAEGITVYVVYRNGDVEVLDGKDVKDNFDDGGFDPMGEEKFKDQVTYDVTFSYQGFEAEPFTVYLAGGERPISTQDATFFDWILVIPVAFLMNFFATLVGNNFAIGILFTTIVVRTLAWPIYAKSNDMSIKMNLAQPDMQRVQAKYATKKDPQSQQQMQMEMMQVYKKHGINVLGCLFPFLQMPIFIAMYGVVRRITLQGGMYAEGVSNTNFFGINLANTQDGIIGMVLAGIVGGTMFLLQKISMKKPSYAKNTAKHNPNPQAEQTEKTMKFVSYFMVIMMAFASYQSNALALYWVFGNIYSLGQTLVNRKLNEKKHETLKKKQLMG